MKKVITVLTIILLVLNYLVPAISFGAVWFGYTIELFNDVVYEAIILGFSVCAVILCFISKDKDYGAVTRFLFILLVPMSLINTGFLVFISDNFWVGILAWISTACFLILALVFGKPTRLKIILLSISAGIAVIVGLLTMFSNFSEVNVKGTYTSPQGGYYAEKIEVDEGALGGSVIVKVYDNKGINLLLFKLKKIPRVVYSADYGSYISRVEFHGEDLIAINYKEYEIHM